MSFHGAVGEVTQFSKRVGETEVYAFADITGDFSPNQVNEQTMRHSPYGGRIAHGALPVGYMSIASTLAIERAPRVECGEMPVFLGYARLCFLKDVRLGETITVTYAIAEIDIERRRWVATVDVNEQAGQFVATRRRILKWVAT